MTISQSQLPFNYGRAICYSGFREGQQPGARYPSFEQIKEDLLILQGHWKYLRLYDCGPHSETVLDVISKENLDFQVMLSAYTIAEMNNYGCPWGGGVYSESELANNKAYNERRIHKLIALAEQYEPYICSLSVGNEACVDWTDHYISVDRVIEFVNTVKNSCPQPVTFCENYVPWLNKLKPLAEVVDFISIHTYPVWEYKKIHEAFEYTRENYYSVAELYPCTPTLITEAGWATNANGRGIEPDNVSEDFQKSYLNELLEWTDQEKITTFVFEAFDEPWKGSPDPFEPEKHWGLYHVDRTPKKFAQQYSKIKPRAGV